MNDELDDFVESMEKILDSLLAIVKEKDYRSSAAQECIEKGLNGKPIAQFIGFLGASLEYRLKRKRIKKSLLIKVLTETAMSAAHLGWREGHDSAIRIYRAA